MASDTPCYTNYKYSSFKIMLYLRQLPLWRRILARFFVKYKITKEEYDKWFYNNFFMGWEKDFGS